MCNAGQASFHFAVALVKSFHQLTDKTQAILREFLTDMAKEETFDEQTNEILEKIIK
jgi:phage regulator Rha-like protein